MCLGSHLTDKDVYYKPPKVWTLGGSCFHVPT
jgi:hypothetical protein